jgi:hypothetical protein
MRIETVAEFLARGGKITKVPPAEPTVKAESIKSSNAGGVVSIITMEDADLYHGEYKPKKAKKKAKSIIDVSALPEELRKKYIDEVLNGSKEEDSDSSEEESNDQEKRS